MCRFGAIAGLKRKAKGSGRLPTQGGDAVLGKDRRFEPSVVCLGSEAHREAVVPHHDFGTGAHELAEQGCERSCEWPGPRCSPRSRYTVPPSRVSCRLISTFSDTHGECAPKWKKSIDSVIVFSISARLA